jgi:hypothetical protein
MYSVPRTRLFITCQPTKAFILLASSKSGELLLLEYIARFCFIYLYIMWIRLRLIRGVFIKQTLVIRYIELIEGLLYFMLTKVEGVGVRIIKDY